MIITKTAFVFVALGIQHAPYCHLWPAPLYIIFPHYLINVTIKIEFIELKMCFPTFSTNLSETFLVLSRTEPDMVEILFRSSRKVRVIIVRFELNLNFIDRFFEMYSNIKFHENPCSGCRVVPCGRSDGQT
jgi:hypothetical protein